MEIYPVYLLNFVLLLVIFRINSYTNSENSYQLKLLKYYFSLLLLITLNLSSYILFEYKLPAAILCIVWVALKIIFYLHLKSIIQKKRIVINFVYFIPILFLLIFDYLNRSGIRFLNFIKNEVYSEIIIGFITTDFIGKEDVLVIYSLSTTLFSILIYYSFFKWINSDNFNQKTEEIVSDFFKYYYNLITLISFSILILLWIYLLNIQLPILIILIKLLIIFTYTVLIVKPKLLRRIASIKISTEIDDGLEIIYKEVEELLLKSKGYLNSDYTLANLSVETGFRSELLRKSIKKYSNFTVPLFINSYRIEYFCELLKNGYLKNYSMEALAKQSGFNSQENFNRVFKMLKECTPSEYNVKLDWYN